MTADGTGKTRIDNGILAPAYVAFDANGNLFIGDQHNHALYEIPVGGAQKQVASGFAGPVSLTTDPSGNIYLADQTAIYCYSTVAGLVNIDPVATNGLMADADFNLYYADFNDSEVYKISPQGGYFTKPELPPGLTIDPNTGVIGGTPPGVSPAANYTVTAFSGTVSGSATLNITVSLPVPPVISYSTPQTYTVATAITPLSPVNTGAAVAAFGFNPVATPVSTGISDAVSMAMDKSGNLYIGEGSGQVSVLPAGGSTATVFATGFGVVYSIALDASNNVYVGDAAHLWKIPAGGGTPVTLGNLSAPVGLAFDPAGNLYVADNAGGDAGVYKMTADGTGQTRIDNGIPAPAYVAFDANGNLFIGDQHNHALYEIPVGGAQKQVASTLVGPVSLTTDPSGNIYLADQRAIYCYSTVAGLVNIDPVPTNGLMADADFNLYYANFNDHKVYKISPQGGYFTKPELPPGLTIDPNSGAISGTPPGVSPAANYTVTAFSSTGSGSAPLNITVSLPPPPVISYSTPQVYEASLAITPSLPANTGAAVGTFGFSTSATILSTGFFDATCLAWGKDGSIYIGESSGKVSVLPPGGSPATVFASGFGPVAGIAVDGPGNVYVADGSSSIRKIPAGGGTAVSLGSFSGPAGVALDASGNIYVADEGAQGVFKMAADGTGQTKITNSNVSSPGSIALDGNGNVFFVDEETNNIFEIPAGGMEKTIFDGNDPISVTTDASGNIYVGSDLSFGLFFSSPAQSIAGTAVNIGPAFPNAMKAVMVDPNFNVYVVSGGVISKINATGGYFVNPELPQGLTIDPNSGAISGTPSGFSPATNYSVTGFSGPVSGNATLNITVNLPPPPVISYSTPQIYTTGTAISPLTLLNTGGAAAALGFNTTGTSLSTGIFDATCLASDRTGNIYIGESSGKISVLAPGASSATVFATGFPLIKGIALDAAGNVYVAAMTKVAKISADGATVFNLGGFISANAVAVDAAGNIYVSDPSSGPLFKMAADGSAKTKISSQRMTAAVTDLNGNVFFCGSSGNVYEIAAGGTLKTVRSFTARTTTMTVDPSGNIYVLFDSGPDIGAIDMFPATGGAEIQAEPAGLDITGGLLIDQNFNLYGVSIGSIIKVSITGGYLISPELPNGLNIDPASGVISGTPSAASPATDYTVTAINIAGKGTATVNIKVNSSDATLNTFQISNGTLTPAFAAGTTTYADTIANFTSSITALLTTTDPNATVTINGTPVTPGLRSPSFPMVVGNNTLSIVVTAQDGVTTKTYTINVNRSLPNNALLSSIKLSPAATLVSTSGPGYLNFNAAVANATSTIQVIPTVQDPDATITVNGTAVTSGSSSSPIALNVGLNVITTVVTAQDGKTTKTAIITVNREGVSNDALIASVSTNPKVTLVGAAGEGYINFTAVVANSTGSIAVIPAAKDPNATITVNGLPVASGSPSTPVRLNVGSNIIVIVITGPDGSTHKFVTITVTRDAPSTNALIASIKTTPVETLVGTTGPGYLNFTATAANSTSNMQVTPTAKDPNATITVNGNPVISGTASSPIALNVGPNVITTVVTAQDGITTKTIMITVNRTGLSTNAQLASISLSPVSTLISITGSGYLNYKSAVANTETSVRVIPTAKDATETIKVNGETVVSGSESQAIALNVGANIITTEITAQDGVSTKTIIITVNRGAPASLNSLYQSISVTQPADSVAIENDGVIVHQAISPNGDGINDFLTIDGITNYPDNRLMIIDKNGVMVYQTKGYDNSSKLFDGHSNINGKMQLPGTYFYSLDYAVNGESKHKTGYIILKY